MSESTDQGRTATTHFAIIPEWVLFKASPTEVKVYAVIDRFTDRHGDAWPTRERVAELVGCSTTTVTRAVAALERLGALERVPQFRDGAQVSNLYRLRRDPPEMSTPLVTGEDGGYAETPSRTRTIENERAEPNGSTHIRPSPPVARRAIQAAWIDHAPPLIKHNQAYLDSAHSRIDAALKTYTTEQVITAIRNYAAVLDSPDHYWNHKWTLRDFLQRGLDKFVDDAEPLTNYQLRQDPTKRKGLSPTEIASMRFG